MHVKPIELAFSYDYVFLPNLDQYMRTNEVISVIVSTNLELSLQNRRQERNK